MYILEFKGNIIKLTLTHLLHKMLCEHDIIRLNIEYNGIEKEYSGTVIEKNAKYIYVELIGEVKQLDNVVFIQQL